MSHTDDLGDRMKIYEMAEAGRKVMPLLPIMARLDGRAFHRLTARMERPYDRKFSLLMMDTLTYLLKESWGTFGYTQSDEITLVWKAESFESKLMFDGRISKLTSILAAQCSVYFNKHFPRFFPSHGDSSMPVFDCRVWGMPDMGEAANAFLWREQDATKNAVQMAARSVLSHKDCMNKHTGELQEMLFQKGINFNDYPSFFKRGTFVQKRKVFTPYTSEELDSLPERHNARTNPELVVGRTQYHMLNMPPFSKVTNRVAVIFDGAEPVVAS